MLRPYAKQRSKKFAKMSSCHENVVKMKANTFSIARSTIGQVVNKIPSQKEKYQQLCF